MYIYIYICIYRLLLRLLAGGGLVRPKREAWQPLRPGGLPMTNYIISLYIYIIASIIISIYIYIYVLHVYMYRERDIGLPQQRQRPGGQRQDRRPAGRHLAPGR